MTIDEATEELLDLVYDPPIFHSDPYVQRKSVETSIADILGDYEPALPPVCPECTYHEREIDRLQDDNDDLNTDVEMLTKKIGVLEGQKADLQDTIDGLNSRLRELEGE